VGGGRWEITVAACQQTDPNWGNFLFDPETGKISVIDFGAANEYSEEFVRNYAKLVRAAVVYWFLCGATVAFVLSSTRLLLQIWAATRQDIDSMMDVSLKMGFLTGDESAAMKQVRQVFCTVFPCCLPVVSWASFCRRI
jgi:aarF domain-containing kinase